MQIRASLNALAAIAVLAMALMTLPPDLAHAADNSPRPKSPAQQSCESRGFHWIQGKCADKTCRWGNFGGPFHLPAKGGETRVIRNADGTSTQQYCDGFTGEWVNVIQPGQSGPPAPPPPTASQ